MMPSLDVSQPLTFILFFLFFFSSRRRHTRLSGDWSSDVCSSDLKCLFRSCSHFLIGLFAFLALSCMSCLYILEINPLSVVSFAIIFSRSEGCFFTLLIVSFSVQKLLSLIRSHLLIFVFISVTLGGGS